MQIIPDCYDGLTLTEMPGDAQKVPVSQLLKLGTLAHRGTRRPRSIDCTRKDHVPTSHPDPITKDGEQRGYWGTPSVLCHDPLANVPRTFHPKMPRI